MYLDGGIAQARRLVEDLILKGEQHKFEVGQDYKTLLQELVQRENGRVLTYRLAGQYGPDHDKRFAVEVDLDGVAMGSGEGRSKKEAEQAAAHQALERISG
ncbi:Ribonuclease 3 [bioreactor metagenome]|uniref:Ribonuclease 3 n=1 Tax=bioreactor metagenome TaxID=1076179 RepID=A0A645DTI4_9ZZZZ